jgi:hypothetical protein
MLREWIAMEHYRYHVVEERPDSPDKEAVLAAIRSSLASLSRYPRIVECKLECWVCLNRHMTPAVVELSNAWQIATQDTKLAA